MPELEPPKKSPDREEPPDPIAKLHKMSTTAGVGSQEYVAINNAAIISVILGLCTFLAFLGLPFLVVGAAGIVFGIIALVQIRHSNGTQGGAGIAILGIILSLAIAGTVATTNLIAWMAQREDERAIDQVLVEMGQHIANNQYDKAWQYLTPDFQANWNAALFRDHLQSLEKFLGKIEGMSSNTAFGFSTTAEGMQMGATQAVIRFRVPTTQSATTQGATAPATAPAPAPAQIEGRRVPVALYKINGKWRVAGMDIFPRKPGQQQ